MRNWVSRSAIVAAALLVSASNSFGVVLYDSGGFEASAGYSTGPGGAGAFLPGQQGWLQGPSGAGNTPLAAVYPYFAPSTPNNEQFVQIQARNVPAANGNFFIPPSGDTVVAPGQAVAITWSMAVLSGVNNPFFGFIAYDTFGAQIAQLGVNGSTGELVGNNGTVFSGFTAAANTYYQYELLLNYTTQTYSVYTAPDGGTNFTLRGSGAFDSAGVLTFSDADLASFSLNYPSGANYNGAANIDNYLVQTVTVPEPASLGLGVVALGLLAKRRRQA